MSKASNIRGYALTHDESLKDKYDKLSAENRELGTKLMDTLKSQQSK